MPPEDHNKNSSTFTSGLFKSAGKKTVFIKARKVHGDVTPTDDGLWEWRRFGKEIARGTVRTKVAALLECSSDLLEDIL